MKPVILLALAERDLDDSALHYTQEAGLELGLRFYDGVEAGLRQIAGHPGLGSPRHSDLPALRGIRFWAVPAFPDHLIFYQDAEEAILVVRVLHGARDILQLFTNS